MPFVYPAFDTGPQSDQLRSAIQALHMDSDEIAITFKVSSGQKFELKLSPSLTVLETKEKTESECGFPKAQQRLIYRGRILKDPETLTSYGIASGHTIHLVRVSSGQTSASNANVEATSATAPTATTTPSFNTAASAQPIQQQQQQPPMTASTPPNLDSLLGALGGSGTGGLGDVDVTGLGGMMGDGFPGGMNPQMFQAIMSNPAVTSMMQEMMRNPELLRSMLQANPFLNSMAQGNPMFQTVLNNPELLRAAMNPEMLQSVMGLQQAFHQQSNPAATTNTAAPQTQQPRPTGFGTVPPPSGGMPDFQSMVNRIMADPQLVDQVRSAMGNMGGGLNTGAGVGPTTTATPPDPALMNEMMSRLMGNMGNMANAGGADNVSPATRYETQLQQLEDMGFIDRDANILALQRTGGDINTAISWLLETGHGS